MTTLSRLSSVLIPAGLDLLHAFPSSLLPTSLLHAGHDHDAPPLLAVLVGSTKALWPAWLNYLAQNPLKKQLELLDDPLDNYVEEICTSAVNAVGMAVKGVWYPHELESERFVDFQRLAHQVGFGYLNQACRLVVHPVHGPWFSLRALLVFDETFPTDLAIPAILPNPYPEADNLLSQKMTGFIKTAANPEEWTERDWRPLVEMRDMAASFLPKDPETGFPRARFSERQIKYHYEKDKKGVWEELEEMR